MQNTIDNEYLDRIADHMDPKSAAMVRRVIANTATQQDRHNVGQIMRDRALWLESLDRDASHCRAMEKLIAPWRVAA